MVREAGCMRFTVCTRQWAVWRIEYKLVKGAPPGAATCWPKLVCCTEVMEFACSSGGTLECRVWGQVRLCSDYCVLLSFSTNNKIPLTDCPRASSSRLETRTKESYCMGSILVENH